jgi:hypothetical protein
MNMFAQLTTLVRMLRWLVRLPLLLAALAAGVAGDPHQRAAAAKSTSSFYQKGPDRKRSPEWRLHQGLKTHNAREVEILIQRSPASGKSPKSTVRTAPSSPANPLPRTSPGPLGCQNINH